MTIEELELAVQDALDNLNTQSDLLNGIYNELSDQQATVDRWQAKLNRLQQAQAVLKGIEEEEEE